MLNREKDVDLARRAKVIEWLKTEVVDHVAHLLKGIWEGSHVKIVDGLASLISSGYILGRRLGISLSQFRRSYCRENEEAPPRGPST